MNKISVRVWGKLCCLGSVCEWGSEIESLLILNKGLDKIIEWSSFFLVYLYYVYMMLFLR